MTPAINAVKKRKVPHKVHEYVHDESAESYGIEATEKMAVAKELVFKTLVVSLDSKELAVAIIPVASRLSMKRIAKATGAKKATMADKADVERSTGYVLGGVSPLGQKKQLRTVIDCSATSCVTVYVSAGRRGLEIELNPAHLIELTRASVDEICTA
ncbi:UNVERIFIED_CONTAM: hypothetical protein GTU68_058322 [Idotea baltica]|nr:hypothetical protein [Idotea baltica]